MIAYNRIRRIYKSVFEFEKNLIVKMHSFKMKAGEIYTLYTNRALYKDVRWTGQQQNEFDTYWKTNYGKKISSKGHKYFESVNGVFHKDYFPEFLYTTKLELKLNDYFYASLFNDKSLFEVIFARQTVAKFPKTILINNNGIFYNSERTIIDIPKAKELLYNCGEVVVKPILGGSEGRGILFPNYSDGKDKNNKIQIDELVNKQAKNFIIQQKIIPNETYNQIHPESLNTIRIMTYLAEGEIHHAPLCMRVGTGKTKVDNLGEGGLLIGVSDTGYLLKYSYKLGDSKERTDKHPDTGILFENYKLDGIPEIIVAAKELHGLTPRIGIISWDMAYSEENEVVLIEANFLAQSLRYPQITHEKPAFGKQTAYMIHLIRKL